MFNDSVSTNSTMYYLRGLSNGSISIM